MTINESYVDFLDKIAKANGCSKTEVCSIIVENFLSYNRGMKRLPLFRQVTKIFYEDEKISSGDPGSNSGIHHPGSVDQDSEHTDLSRDDIIDQLNDYDLPEEVIDPDAMPF